MSYSSVRLLRGIFYWFTIDKEGQIMPRQSSNKEDNSQNREEKSRRAPRGEGSVYQRADGRWVAQVPLEDGRRKLIYRKTEKEALSALRKALNDQEQGTLATGPQQTLKTYPT